MKYFMATFLILFQAVASAETISKWTDANGRVHYGDNRPLESPVSESELTIQNTFDEDSYKAASRRYNEYEKELKLKEKQRKDNAKKVKRSAKKPPLSASEKYDLYLENEEQKERVELERKRERRADARRKWKMDCHDSRNANRISCR